MGNMRKDLNLGREASTPPKPKPSIKPYQTSYGNNAASSSKKGVNVSPGSAAASASTAGAITPGRSKTVRRYQPERSQSPEIAESPALSLDVKAALKELEDLIALYSSSVGRFVESHLNNDKELLDVHDAVRALSEPARSDQPKASNHVSWRKFTLAMTTIIE